MNIDIDINNDFLDENDLNEHKFNWKKFFIILSIIFLFIICAIVYSRYKSTSGLKIYEYKITDSSLPDSFHGVKIVQFSDIYYGNTVNSDYLSFIVSEINKLKPDIVVYTGDFSDNQISQDEKKQIIDILSSINSTIGKYSISGDIDDISLFDDIFKSSGFTILKNNSVDVYYKGNTPIVISNQDISSDFFNILLIHQPDVIDKFENKFNLVLSGHSLNGQINIPFIKNLFLHNGSKKYINGYYVANGNPLYVSNGIGTTSFKYRLFNKPSVSLFRLTKY